MPDFLEKLAICNEPWWEHGIKDFDAQCAAIAAAGYRGVELAPYTFTDKGGYVTDLSMRERVKIRKTAEDHGLAIVGLHWLLAFTDGLHVTHPDRLVRRRTALYLVELVRFCGDLGGRIMVWGSPSQRKLLDGVNYAHASNWAYEVWEPAVGEAAKSGITICVEPLATFVKDSNFITQASEAARFAAGFDLEFGRGRVKVILDCYSMAEESGSLEGLIRYYKQEIGHIHLNDGNMQGPGMAAMSDGRDFGGVIRGLSAINYHDWLSVEALDVSPGPDRIATESMTYLRQLLMAQ